LGNIEYLFWKRGKMFCKKKKKGGVAEVHLLFPWER